MIDILYKLNCKLYNGNAFLEKAKINSAGRFLLRCMANFVLPAYLKITGKQAQNKVDKCAETLPVVVSMTSFPVRIAKLWIVIEAILRQNPRPERVVLWLSKEQFPHGIADLPSRLTRQQARGLEIRFVDGDIRSHKKYYYAFTEFADKYVLTIDDDLLFPSTFVSDVYRCALQHPDSVIANFGSKFTWNPEIGYIARTDGIIRHLETGKDLFFGSGGGTLFLPSRLLPYFDDIDTIWRLCPTADDIYLNSIVRLAGMDITFRGVFPLLSITNNGDVKLTDHNGNLYSPDSVNASQLRNLVSHQQAKYGRNPFAIR